MPILDLRLRKAVRHYGAAPGGRLRAPDRARRRRRGDRPLRARRRGRLPRRARRRARPATRPPSEPARRRRRAARRRAAPGQDAGDLGRAARPRPRRRDGARLAARDRRRARLLRRRRRRCSRSPTAPTPAALREVGCLPGAGPGLRRGRGRPRPRGDQAGPRSTASSTASSSSHADPVRDLPDGPGWAEALQPRPHRALDLDASRTRRPRPPTSSSPPRPTPRRRAPSPIPTAACSACAPRSRAPATCARSGRSWPSSPRPLGHETGIDSAPEALAAIAAEVPFYAGLTPEEIGGTGVRWQDRAQAAPSASGERLSQRSSGRAEPDAVRRSRTRPRDRRPAPTAASRWGPTATSGPAR